VQSRPLRCHLQLETIGRQTFRVLMPRPADGLRVSTNRFHDTWHLLCAPGHVRALRRLFWAMAYARQPGTLVALTGPTLAPTPFDAARSLPVLIACSSLVRLGHDEVRELLHRLQKRRSDGTVKLQTFGLEQVEALDPKAERQWFRAQHREAAEAGWEDLKVEQIGGAIAFHGPAPLLRTAAAALQRLERPLAPNDFNYTYVGEYNPEVGQSGEVQVFGDYKGMLTDARLVREGLLPALQGLPPELQVEELCEARARRTARRQRRKAAMSSES
jgi:hypothetical protein